ncbi:hypothetical protein C0Z18_22655 [Trinickia dabaoshanensis]|uniref:Uncharacterized protein n=2 Tax=Trinickia dabaoshanensis TaxID=564714 RepID=A0A2N7VHL3_9BURK|nr:hypothetical protein C0Z18_22655 [Trinickia dabaoshanensis]
MPQLYAAAGMISSIGFAATQYGNSADHVIFRTLYNVAERDLVYYQGGNQGTKRVLSAPCMICGLVLPLANLTIDHQRPQSGGELEAVAKVFRTFGLTKEGPKGPKGLLIQAHLRSVNPSLATFGSVAPQPGRAAAAGTSLSERYTLNDQGALLLSFVLAAGEIQKLKTSCMNSIVNLRPACGVCNSSRGNPLKFSP